MTTPDHTESPVWMVECVNCAADLPELPYSVNGSGRVVCSRACVDDLCRIADEDGVEVGKMIREWVER